MAWNKARQQRALQKLWTDRCTVIVRVKKKDEQSKLTDFVEETLFEEEPCKLSFESLSTTGEGNVPSLGQAAKLFMSNEKEVPAGSKIIVTRQGKTFTFARSGEPGWFTWHQEINLELWKRWA
jgi:hypothetical protein